MAAVNSKIAFIQKQCNNYSQTSAEGLMYGVANIMTMKPKELDALLDQEGYDDKEMFAAEQRRASEIIRKAGLDLALIKTGSFLILRFYTGSKRSKFYRGLTKMKSPIFFHTVVLYIIDSLDDEYRAAFRKGNTMNDIVAFQKRLMAAADSENDVASDDEKNTSEDNNFFDDLIKKAFDESDDPDALDEWMENAELEDPMEVVFEAEDGYAEESFELMVPVTLSHSSVK